jgi:type I restriction enzyme M protein
MLDNDTKRRIDSCRDILVGKVPDPKSQIEQITIALIYKFMDDMDAQTEQMGGKRSFFMNGFEKYGWGKLLAPSMGGQDTLNLYSEAISKMSENTHLPALFRDIFKNAYLPYRDPETLKAFLKEIDAFSYDHSERLGDAFEYLLSVLGSQGDAGQFRTPRHIMDFIVRVVNPQKNERILDPACGTAGFLISAWKHILEQNRKDRPGDLLTPDERNQLAENINGYDISPDMVRLSLVNLYLHGFTRPHIYEYDTLTSEDKWNEHFDVILANPPFMSPKGGIRPHKRFSIQATRSEVLFVDYMHEHLSPNGRAGIIVPEGIVFQSGTAYKALRETLLKHSLVAVVSLPAGVFQPYSGVKTSILILDKRLSKKTKKVLFVKVTSDGYAAGVQRRRVEQNDLPKAQAALEAFFSEPENFVDNHLAWAVDRDLIAKSIDLSLNGERYQHANDESTKYPLVALSEVAQLIRGITFAKSDQLEGPTADSLRVATTKAAQESGIVEQDLYHIPKRLLKYEEKRLREGDILISTANSLNLLGRTTHVKNLRAPTSFGAFMSVIRPSKKVLDTYLLHLLKSPFALEFFRRNANTTTNISNLNFSVLGQLRIPLPPIEIQRAIVDKIEEHQLRIRDFKGKIEECEQGIKSAVNEVWEV